MKKNGFIATSILYSFFLMFITLILLLISNFINNKILIKKINTEATDFINNINDTKISDLIVGDRVIFTIKSDSNGNTIMNPTSKWIVASVTASGENRTIKLLSDMKIGNTYYFKKSSENTAKNHYITIDVFNELKSTYNSSVLYNDTHTNKFSFDIPTTSLFTNIKNNSVNYDSSTLNAIFNTYGGFVVYVDSAISGYTQSSYYSYRYYSLSSNDSAKVDSICGTASSPFNYRNETYTMKKDKKYVNYCLYSNTSNYTDTVFGTNKNINDKITDTSALGYDVEKQSYIYGSETQSNSVINYNVRIMATITISTNDTDTYVSGGKGTLTDPYIIANGIK